MVAAYYKLLLQSGKENTGEMSRFRGSIGYELDMHGQWGGELAVCLSHVVLCEGMDAAEILLQASAACFALLALSGIQACFREREREGGSGLVWCVRAVLLQWTMVRRGPELQELSASMDVPTQNFIFI